ncbi:hypothetical protein [Oceanobacillus bengalensis]|uniref:YokE-like PH domain-containing protein n=1 Tax=Oceanobacillus bengalensis TaxID=1435466 RepID=A0A494YSG3_9BACI|nr:hypothetical protein [Oceanobacillus bengalensis]RKQ12868.1 hypothetical protein D8M05_17505 [Oceanobacillus bengalensis]
MYLIAEQPYIKVERRVTSIEQVDIEHERTMYLYNEKIITKHREFPIKDILDMSYRLVGVKGGLLYLHTSKGVYSYIVKSSPEHFIQMYKMHIKK